MSINKKKILVVGLFLSEENKHLIYRTAADQLAELLVKNNYPIITTSTYLNKVKRYIDTIYTILFKSNAVHLAIIPLYGGFKSYIWESTTSMLLKMLGKKTVLIIHGGSIPERMKTQSKKYLRTIQRADFVICPSNYIISALKEYNQKSILIENVLNLNDYTFHPKKEFRPMLFWMRTFEDIYNPLMAVRVFAILKQKFPNAKMVMAGHDRGMLQETKDYVMQLNLQGSIEFPGYITNQQKNQFAADLDFYICTNKVDNAPVSLIEMMSLGLPVVTVNSGGIPYMVTDEYNCLLVNYDDDKKMAEKIVSIIEDPSIGKTLVQNGLLTVQRYGEKQVMGKWKRLFDKLNY